MQVPRLMVFKLKNKFNILPDESLQTWKIKARAMKTIVLVDAILKTENYLPTVAIICILKLTRNWYC
jgi:hypothetical protein